MAIRLFNDYGACLTRAESAAKLCARILGSTATEPVVLDFANTVQMSPSFANTLFFNLLQRFGVDELTRRVRVENAAPHILAAINTAIERKANRHVELTSYLISP